ncbi:hypothetical protein WH47_01632, partial [Habropoda laboriosa]
KMERTENINVDSSNRKSKILRSLAFLAGLNVGDLVGAASSDVKTTFPPFTLTVGASKISPHIAATYDPYPYVSQPYIFVTPPRLHTLWNLLTQNSQVLNLLDNNKQSDLLNKDDEYVDEAKKIENVKTVSSTKEEADKSVELQREDDWNVTDKVFSGTACNLQNGNNMKRGNLLNGQGLRAASPIEQLTSVNATNQNTTQMPGTAPKNETNNSSFYGYYDGHPQDINYISFTTETYDPKYHDYERINYNLPSYERPVNFYSDESHDYHLVPPDDRYPSNQFHHEQIPEYLANDFKKFVYSPDNTPFTNSDFRPLV